MEERADCSSATTTPANLAAGEADERAFAAQLDIKPDPVAARIRMRTAALRAARACPDAQERLRMDLTWALPVGPTHLADHAAEACAKVIVWAEQCCGLDPAGWTEIPTAEGLRRAVHQCGYALGAWLSTLGWTARLYATDGQPS